MTNLFALEFRLLCRGLRPFAPVLSILVPVALLAMLSHEEITPEKLAGWALFPTLLLAVAGTVTAQAGESMAWLAPLRHFSRVWSRAALFAVIGAFMAGLILALHAVTGTTPREPWILLALHLWLVFQAGGLLLLFATDVTRRQHAVISAIAVVIAILPACAVTSMHVARGFPAAWLAVEAAAWAILLGLNLLVHRDLEPGRSLLGMNVMEEAPVPPTEPAPLPKPAGMVLDRRPDPVPVLSRGLWSYKVVWLFSIGWMLIALLPDPVLYAVFGLLCMTLLVQRALGHWAPFQASPVSRRLVLRRLFAPIFLLWALTLVIQCATPWILTPSVLNYRGDRFSLPDFKRDIDTHLPPVLQKYPASDEPLPRDPDQVAALMSRAFRLSYGLEVPPADILAVRASVPGDSHKEWLLEVERRWKTPILAWVLQWRLATGLFVLTAGLLTLVEALWGSWPRVLIRALKGIGMLFWFLPLLVLGFGWLLSHAPRPLRELYAELFDRPWIALAFLGIVSLLLGLRHVRTFCRSAITPTPLQSM